MQDWKPASAVLPSFNDRVAETLFPGVIISVDYADTVSRISPYLTGYNQPVHVRGAFNEEPQAVRHIRNVRPNVMRYPGGTAAMTFFWDRSLSDGPPPDVDTYIRSGETDDKYRYGMTGGDFFNLDRYYALIDSVQGLNSIIVVNYGYARYGRSENPVARAAHYAAEWVRYDRGRTKFWEIGNELSGQWTPGHQIDTIKNKDGQPVYLTGTLYGRHFRIFVDSMRAAAAEKGFEIKIGGVLSHTEDSWNREFLRTASDKADFLVVHEYYGSVSTSDPVYAVTSADDLILKKDIADSDIENYSVQPLPVVLTEWNSKDELQADRCIYGMSNLRALKNIIESKYGLSCRHTLLQKNERGLINTGEVYNPLIGLWQPRASFFYFYYLGKTLGDMYYPSKVSGNEKVEAIASSFSSGEKGIVVMNYSDQNQDIALDLKNFKVSPRYYRFTLTPWENDPFSAKVRVNGQTNSSYDKGGPFNYEEVKAVSSLTDGPVCFSLPAYSTACLLMEGGNRGGENPHTIAFEVFGKIRDSVFHIPGTFISLNSYASFTSENGEAVFTTSEDSISFSLRKVGFELVNSSFEATGDTLITDTLNISKFTVNIELRDAASLEVLAGIPLILDGIGEVSALDGHVMFESVPGGNSELVIDTQDYYLSRVITVLSDTSIVLFLEKKVYNLGIQVIDSINRRPVSGASVSIGGENYFTDLEGYLELRVEPGSTDVIVDDENYRNKSINIDITSDSLVTVLLFPLFADLKFIVYEGGNPLNEAGITIAGEEKITNQLGMCTFSSLTTGQLYTFMISKPGFKSINSIVELNSDTTLEINMNPSTGISKAMGNKIQIYPNPASGYVTLRSDERIYEIRIFDITGREMENISAGGTKEVIYKVREFDDGIYIVKVYGQGFRASKYLMIQNE